MRPSATRKPPDIGAHQTFGRGAVSLSSMPGLGPTIAEMKEVGEVADCNEQVIL